jgi:hypothetical protein
MLEKPSNTLYRGLLLLSLVSSGCVSFPIPPTGDDMGKYGRLEIKITYVPNVQTFIDRMRKGGQTPTPSYK